MRSATFLICGYPMSRFTKDDYSGISMHYKATYSLLDLSSTELVNVRLPIVQNWVKIFSACTDLAKFRQISHSDIKFLRLNL